MAKLNILLLFKNGIDQFACAMLITVFISVNVNHHSKMNVYVSSLILDVCDIKAGKELMMQLRTI